VLPGIGHLLPTQAPETISRALAEELRT
jgi:hypothetical protein